MIMFDGRAPTCSLAVGMFELRARFRLAPEVARHAAAAGPGASNLWHRSGLKKGKERKCFPLPQRARSCSALPFHLFDDEAR